MEGLLTEMIGSLIDRAADFVGGQVAESTTWKEWKKKNLHSEEFKTKLDSQRENNLLLQGEIDQLKSLLRQKDLTIDELRRSLLASKESEEMARKDFTPKISSSSVDYQQAIQDFQAKTLEQKENILTLKKEKENPRS